MSNEKLICQIEGRDDWRVIRRALPTPRLDVDAATGAAGRERRACEDEINTKTGVSTKTRRAVVPPAE